MAKNVGIGVIGTGFARKVQIPGFLMCEKAEIISIASGSRANAESAAKEFGIGHFTDDWRETAAHDGVELVCVTTPPNLHLEMALSSLQNGKHILCEKPMAMSVAEAEEMTAAAAKTDRLALIDHELRFLPGRLKAFQMLRDGAIGKVRHAKYSFRAAYRSNADLPWNWWSDIEQGGGALGAIGSHVVDSILWLLGTEIESVFCQLGAAVKERKNSKGEPAEVTADDEAMMVLRFADSNITDAATGLVSVAMAEPPEYQNRVELFGTEGSMRIDQRGELYVSKLADREWKPVDVGYGRGVEGVPDTGFPGGFTEFAPRIVEAIANGSGKIEHAATFADGLKVQRVLDAARESNTEGRTVFFGGRDREY